MQFIYQAWSFMVNIRSFYQYYCLSLLCFLRSSDSNTRFYWTNYSSFSFTSVVWVVANYVDHFVVCMNVCVCCRNGRGWQIRKLNKRIAPCLSFAHYSMCTFPDIRCYKGTYLNSIYCEYISELHMLVTFFGYSVRTNWSLLFIHYNVGKPWRLSDHFRSLDAQLHLLMRW